MDKKTIISDLTRYYEVDLENCNMTHKQWINQIAEALTDPEYLNKFNTELRLYNQAINQ